MFLFSLQQARVQIMLIQTNSNIVLFASMLKIAITTEALYAMCFPSVISLLGKVMLATMERSAVMCSGFFCSLCGRSGFGHFLAGCGMEAACKGERVLCICMNKCLNIQCSFTASGIKFIVN